MLAMRPEQDRDEWRRVRASKPRSVGGGPLESQPHHDRCRAAGGDSMHTRKPSTLTSRRHFLEQAAAGGALTVGSLAGARRAVAAASELRILFPGGSWQEWFNNTFAKPFEQAARVQTVWKLGLSFEPLVIAQRRRPAMGPDSREPEHVQPARRHERRGRVERGAYPEPQDDAPRVPLPAPGRQGPHALRAGRQHQAHQAAGRRLGRPLGPGVRRQGRLPRLGWMGEEVFHAINSWRAGRPRTSTPASPS